MSLFPLNSSWRFTADVVHNPVNAFHGINNLVRYRSQKIIWQMGPIGGHAIHAGYSPQRDSVFIRPFVAHYAYAAYR